MTKTLRIVMVLPEPPVPFGGAAARWFYVLLCGMVARGHRVTTFCPAPDTDGGLETLRGTLPASVYDIRAFPSIQKSGWKSKLASLARPYSYMFSSEFQQHLDQELGKGFDVLHLEQLWSGWTGLDHCAKASLHVHYNLFRDLGGEKANSWREWVLRKRLAQSERFLLRRYSTISCLSEPLRDHIQKISPQADVHVVPLGIDSALYPYAGKTRASDSVTIGLVGSFNWLPSLQAGRRLLASLWPAIRERIPNARLLIAGRQARTAFAGHTDQPAIDIFENVADILPFFRQLDVMLYAPHDASGTKVKVQEAFALGVPVVTTPSGVEGLEARDGIHVCVAESDGDLVEKTIVLLQDPERRHRQAQAARELICATCSPEVTTKKMEAVFHSIASKQPGGNQ
ncbi:biofilm formation protein PslH [Bryobacterales bacterium F-183]|nr:biofilm formation protein PslH [Bryobacterales bacterium F-183]